MESRTATAESSSNNNKRPRSPSGDFPPLAAKMPKTHSSHLQINYLARQYPENIPLVSTEDTLPNILRLIGEYDGVIHRHESIAGNLGACPLGPILVKRFERLFDGPPKVLKSNGKEGSTVTWLDVVEFAKNKPEQFNLEKSRNGVRVCQIYTKQSRVEISEEDYVLIASGMPQKMIPPQPISEDEEKELGALEILEKNLGQVIQLADQGKLAWSRVMLTPGSELIFGLRIVSARARQLNHRLKNRKTAIISRRETEAIHHQRSSSPWRDTNGNGHGAHPSSNGQSRAHSPPSGFVAVNARHGSHDEDPVSGAHFMFSHPNTDNVTIINGTSIKGASPTTRAELMKKFFTTADRVRDEVSASSGRQQSRSRPRASDPGEYAVTTYASSHGPVAIPNTPTSLLPQPKTTSHYERDDGGPFKIEMVSRMEDLQRGERILPPCDRCRRLHMDCLKNLTACMGCTKKHAKCSWKEVKMEELRDQYPRREPGQQSPRDAPEGDVLRPESDRNQPPRSAGSPAISNPSTRPASEPQQTARPSPPPRAVSEHMPSTSSNNNKWIPPRRHEMDDQDTNDPLAQAIMDTVDQHFARAAASGRDKAGERPGINNNPEDERDGHRTS
ncbi:hypothetical protein AJ80_00184 [Polytolypa hystricis UAMH7299]|uniref:Zn(2)-C6 fungal-type domain-containing protein n=1 Tax=Polytolypa hystricis (strain UAMH7299) TaxID=1447883 RepID=A0A2B7Z4Y6_POLH7|nr:hypothetical protein AJ80_00184 [Polytolypa hystricis UAMH7299]